MVDRPRRAKILLHVGAHKTGTTSIQHTLAANRSWLAENGIYYPDPKPFFHSQSVAHHDLAHALAGNSPGQLEKAARFREHLKGASQVHSTILLSAEPFYRHILKPSKNEKADHYESDTIRLSDDEILFARERYIEKVGEYFDGFDVNVILFLRRHDNFVESLYRSSVANTPYSGGFEKYIQRSKFKFDYQRQISIFSQYIGQVSVYSYEQSLNQGIRNKFLEAIGLGDRQLSGTSNEGRLRASLAGKAVLWIDRSKQEGDLAKNAVQRRWHFALLPGSGFAAEGKTTHWKSIEDRDAFLDRHASPQLAHLFPPPDASLPPLAVLTDQEYHEISARFLKWEKDNAAYIRGREKRRLPAYFIESAEKSDTPLLRRLRRGEKAVVAICCITRYRPKMLSALLDSWSRLTFPPDVEPFFVVVDNDEMGSGKKIVDEFRARIGAGGLVYEIEPEVGIPYARNAAVNVALSKGAELIAFVDDDEVVAVDWFEKLYEVYDKSGAQLVGGPVRAAFASTPKSAAERMVQQGIQNRYERIERSATEKLKKGNLRNLAILTNNWLADAELFTRHKLSFDRSLRFTGGSDTKFFRDAIAKGIRTGWAPDALVYETIPRERTSLAYQYQRGKEQSKTSIRAKIKTKGRLKVLPAMLASLAFRTAGAGLLLAATPFSQGRTLVRFSRSCGWIAGRLSGFVGRESNLYRKITGG